MLIQHNFIHADLHAGNIFVAIKDTKTSLSEWVKDRIYIIKRWFESQYVTFFERNSVLKELYF